MASFVVIMTTKYYDSSCYQAADSFRNSDISRSKKTSEVEYDTIRK